MSSMIDIDQVLNDAVSITEEYLGKLPISDKTAARDRQRRHDARTAICPLFVQYLSEDTLSYEAGKSILRHVLKDHELAAPATTISKTEAANLVRSYANTYPKEFQNWCNEFEHDDHVVERSEIQKYLKRYVVGLINNTSIEIPCLFDNDLTMEQDEDNDETFKAMAKDIVTRLFSPELYSEKHLDVVREALGFARQYRDAINVNTSPDHKRSATHAP